MGKSETDKMDGADRAVIYEKQDLVVVNDS